MHISLYCTNTTCTSVRNPNGKIRYKTKEFKKTIQFCDFRPGQHKCDDCSSILILGNRRQPISKEGRHGARNRV
jgi:hypothetical protein